MNPFQIAWDLLKANSNFIDEREPRNPLGIISKPDSLIQSRLFPKEDRFPASPKGADNVNREMWRNTAALKLADQRVKARAHLQQNPAHLRRVQLKNGANYHMMAGNKKIGQVNIDRNALDGMPHIEGEDDEHTIGNGEVNREYQRQGVYGRALQGIINDVGSLSSNSRNNNSHPFHQQFNPPNTDKHMMENDPKWYDIERQKVNYTQQPPKETPRDWGALQYDTGAMPVLDDKGPLQPPALEPSNREQTSLGQWGYVPGYPRYN